MASQHDPATEDPGSRSSGNQGSRGSRGLANDGALPDQGSHDGRDKPASPRSPDLRDADAQGGGGAASDSSRSR